MDREKPGKRIVSHEELMEGIRKIEGPAFTAPELAAGSRSKRRQRPRASLQPCRQRNPLDEKARSEGVIESVTHEDAGCWNCVVRAPASCRGDFYRRFFNVMATETLALFEHLEFDFLEEFDDKGWIARRGRTRDHHPPASLPSVPAHATTTRTSTASVQSRENSRTRSSGSAVASIDRRRETRSIASSPTSNTSSTGLRPPRRAGGLPRPARLTYSIDSTDVRTMPADQDASKGYDPTAEEYYHGYGCTIVSTGKDPDCRGVHREQASARGWRCASRVTRSPSRNRSGCLETAPTTRSAGTTTCWPQGRASRSSTTHETPTIRKTSSTGSKPASTNTARTFS